MTIPSGIDSQIGFAEETTYGTAVTVDEFVEYESESIGLDVQHTRVMPLGKGRYQRSGYVTRDVRGGTGNLVVPLMTHGLQRLLKHMLGGFSSSVTGTSETTHVLTPDASALAGLSLTLQKGVPDVGGTVRPITFNGVVFTGWELACEVDDYAKLTLNSDVKGVDTATSLEAVSLPGTNYPLVFSHGSLTLDASAADVRSVSMSMENALKTDRRFLSNTKKQPIPNAEAPLTGNLEMEFESLDALNAWINGTLAKLVLTFDSGVEIETGSNFRVVVTIEKLEYTGSMPQVGGPDVVMQPRPFKALYDGTNPLVKVEYINDEAAIT